MSYLDKYLDAARELRALKVAESEDGKTPARSQAIADALYCVQSYGAMMSAREHWLAARTLTKKG